jgi:hypothetical protein
MVSLCGYCTYRLRSLLYAWDFRSYFREPYCKEHGLVFKSKNDLAIDLIDTYQSSEDELVYVLVDSWNTSKKLIDQCSQKGFHLIGGLRANRKIYPVGIGIKITEFASQFIQKRDLHSVTVGDHKYKLFVYVGHLSDTESAKVLLLSWKGEFNSSKTPFCILCTDCSLDLVTILRYYNVRWSIETGYRYFKDLLGFDEYQLLSHKGIERYWCIEFLTYNFLEHQRHKWQGDFPLTIGDVVRRIRKDHLGLIAVYAYEQALSQKPLSSVLKELRLTA